MRWVDEVVEAAPYVTTIETLDRYACDFCSHGNDLTADANGVDTYKWVKEAGRYKEVERTRGVSTTDIINRMLRVGQPESQENDAAEGEDGIEAAESSPYTGSKSPYLLTSQKLAQFGSGKDISVNHNSIYPS